MDRAWWHEYGPSIKAGPELWTTNRETARVYGLHWIRGEQGGGISKEPNTIRMGGNSGFQAVGLALHFGAAKVVLLGYDMQLSGGKTHWHGDHKKLGNPVASKMAGWHQRFNQLAGQCGVPIINASRETALKCFPRLSLHESLAES